MALSTEQKKINTQLAVPVWVGILKQNNVDPKIIPLLIAQIIFESGWFNSRAYKLDNNPAGITWNNNYKTRPGATVGIARKSSEGGNYVHFVDYNAAAKDYLRILNRAPGYPLQATDAADYAKRLKQNKYYTDNVDQYAAGLKSIGNRVQEWTDIATLIKKKNSLTMAGISPVVIGLLLGFLIYRKK